MDDTPLLTYDVIVAVLTSTVGILRRRRLVRGFLAPPHSRGLLADLLLVMPDLGPLARIILPLLPHAWPVHNAATKGRLDVIEHVFDCGLLGTPDAPNASRVQAILAAANAAEHVHILRWTLKHWLSVVESQVWLAQRAILEAANVMPAERAIEMLNFWVHETGLLEASPEKRQAVFTDEVVYKSIEGAFERERIKVLEWWGHHAHVSRQAGLWNWYWVYSAIQSVECSIVGLCADLEDSGQIRFTKTRWDGGTSVTHLDLDRDDTLCSKVMDMASRPSYLRARSGKSHVDILRFWKQRQDSQGKPLVYSSQAIEQARSPEVLDWWFTESQLPLQYSSKKSLNFATTGGLTAILDWWLHAWKTGLVPELDYDEWIMIRATTHCITDADGNVTAVTKNVRGSTAWKCDAASWWDKSGLNLKLPGPSSPVPSVIDLCASEPALNWWLQRARRLKAEAAAAGHAELPLVTFFPYYTTAGIYRAAYWGSTGVFMWWKNMYTKGILPPCKPFTPRQPYSFHRLVELAAMCADEWSYNYNLRTVLASLAEEVSFRGSLVEWARQRVLRPENPLPEYGPSTVRRVCAQFEIDPENGGLPPPEDGYVRQRPGEEMVFSW